MASKRTIIWLAFCLTFVLPACALFSLSPDSRGWKTGLRYDAPVDQASVAYDGSDVFALPYDEGDLSPGPSAACRLFAQISSDLEFLAAKGTLTAAERAEIQAIANKYNSTVDVVGSRAAGAGRNVETTLPVGKGANLRSDIDFRIDASHPQVGDLIKDLKGVGGGAGSASTKYSTTTRPTQPPFIRFEPNP